MSGYPRSSYNAGYPYEQPDMNTDNNGYPSQLPNPMHAFENASFPALPMPPDPASFAQLMAAMHQNNNMNGFHENGNVSAYPPAFGTEQPYPLRPPPPLWNSQGEPASSFFQQPVQPTHPAKWDDQQDFYTKSSTSHLPMAQGEQGEQAYNGRLSADLSEGEFEEYSPSAPQALPMYPNKSRNRRTPGKPVVGGQQAATMNPHHHTQAMPATDAYGRTIQPLPRSDSYSPRLSPVQSTQSIPTGPKAFQSRTRVPARIRKVRDSPVELDYSEPDDNKVTTANVETMQILVDARKRAQDAILKLLPHKVFFDDYLGEGIDESVIRAQFQQLNIPLPNPPPGTVIPEPVAKPSVPVIPEKAPRSTSTPSLAPHKATPVVTTGSPLNIAGKDITSSKNVTPGEERKDRIARLLAEKAKKTATTTALVNAPVIATVPVSIPVPVDPRRAEKERLLKQKMEALQKSREARAQKLSTRHAATESDLTTAQTTSPTHATSIPPVSAPQMPPGVDLPSRPASEASTPKITNLPINVTTIQTVIPTSSAYNSPSIAASTIPALPPLNTAMLPMLPGIPGLFLSGNPSNPSSSVPSITTPVTLNQRKRPVASDFDSPPLSEGSYKRPFGQSRENSKLVIDVSDEESGDEATNGQPTFAGGKTGTMTPLQSAQEQNAHMRALPTSIEMPHEITQPSYTPAASMPSTPQPQSSSRGQSQKPIDAQSHAQELLALKKKLALMELRKAKKIQSQTPIQNPTMVKMTPQKPSVSALPAAAAIASISHKNLVDAANNRIEKDQQSLADAIAVKSEVVQNILESRASQDKSSSQATATDAVTSALATDADNQAKLASVADQIAKMQQSLQEALRLQAELQAAITPSSNRTIPREPIAKDASAENDKTIIEAPAKKVTDDDIMTEDVPEVTENIVPEPDSEPLSNGVTTESDIAQVEVVSPSMPVQVETTSSTTIPHTHSSLDAALQKSIANEVSVAQETSSDIDMGETYAPDPNALAPVSSCDGSEAGEVMSIASSPVLENATTDLSKPSESQDDVVIARHDTPKSSDLEMIVAGTEGGVRSHVPAVVENKKEQNPSFVPYQSPLKMFHHYRFHPKYTEQVSGGFRSLTYSNKIKASQELCPLNAAGDVCNDPKCDYQHWKDMEVHDAALLVQLGNADGYVDKTEKQRFVNGLRELLMDLRARKAMDFNDIAGEVAAFQIRFLKDPSNILNLGDVAI